jgi:radical SAM superfamily enzyme YgiQ (UPF0313 family)
MIKKYIDAIPEGSLVHVLCSYPYRRELNDVGFFPPLGLEFIAKVIQPFSKQIEIVDMRKEQGRTRDFIRPETGMVCFSINWDRDQDFLCEEIRSVPDGIFVFLGGRHASENPERWLADFPNVNAVVRGDGEEAVEAICRGVPFKDITGLSFRSGDVIIHNENRIPGPIQDNIFPDRSLRKYSYEMAFGGANTGLEVDMIASSRGCPFNCNFCSFGRNPWGVKRTWTARSAESVVAEIEQTHARLIGFTDDLFTFDMDRVEKICDLIITRGIRKKYFINARLEIAKRPDVMRKMEKAGFVLLMLGIESAHDKTLKSMGKGFNIAQIRKYFEILSKTSMILHGYFILGNIGESRKDMERILPFAKELGLDTIALSTLRVAPYSGLDELVKANPGYRIALDGKVFSDECSVQYLRAFRHQTYQGFYNLFQMLRIFNKSIRLGAFAFVPSILHRLPKFLLNVIKYRRRRARRRAEKRAKTAVAKYTL